jgi:hypothetical protein
MSTLPGSSAADAGPLSTLAGGEALSHPHASPELMPSDAPLGGLTVDHSLSMMASDKSRKSQREGHLWVGGISVTDLPSDIQGTASWSDDGAIRWAVAVC